MRMLPWVKVGSCSGLGLNPGDGGLKADIVCVLWPVLQGGGRLPRSFVKGWRVSASGGQWVGTLCCGNIWTLCGGDVGTC